MNPSLMVSKLEEVAVKPFPYFYKEILMILETSGGCCESIIDGLEFRGGCCEANCIRLQRNFNGFGSFRRLRESSIDGLESQGECREAIYTPLKINSHGFGSFKRLL